MARDRKSPFTCWTCSKHIEEDGLHYCSTVTKATCELGGTARFRIRDTELDRDCDLHSERKKNGDQSPPTHICTFQSREAAVGEAIA